jgi:cytochrome c553
MKPVVANLSEDDIIAISAYLGSLNPGDPPRPPELRSAPDRVKRPRPDPVS